MRKQCIVLAACAAVVSTGVAFASSGTWTGGGGDGLWSTGANWSGGTAPGVADGTFTSTDIATFSGVSAPSDPIATVGVTVDADRNIGGLLFDNIDSTSFALTGGPLRLTGGGAIVGGPNVLNSATTNVTYLINAPIVVHGNSLTFTANQPVGRQGGILPRGTVSFITPGDATLTFDGTNTDNQNVQQSTNQMQVGLSDPAGGKLSVVKSGSGTWEFFPQDTTAEPFFTYSGDTVLNAGIVRLRGTGAVGALTSSGVSPNSRYVSNGGIIRFGHDGLIAKAVQLNDPTVHQALRTSNTQGVKVRLAANDGPALQMNFSSSTPVGVLPTNNHLIFLGDTDYEGGIELNNLGNPIGPVNIGQTQVAYEFGDRIRPIDVDLGDISLGTYDLRIVAAVNGSAGMVKLGAGRLRLDSVANALSGLVEVREGTLLLNNANSFISRPALNVTGGTFNVGGDHQQSFSSVTVSAGGITASNAGSRLLADTITLSPAAGVEVVIDPAIDNLGGSTTLTKTGAGRAILSGANTYTGLTTIEAGTLQLDGDSNDIVVGGPNIADPGGADLRGGQIVFDYVGTTSPLNEVLQALVAGRGSNYADFVPGLIKLKSTTATSSRGLGYIDDTTGSLLTVASTLYGDADLDFTVGFADLLAVAQSYDAPGVWSNGDFDYDGAVGFTDLLALAQNYGTAATTDGTIRLDADIASSFQSDWALARSLVPEPAVVTTLVGAACLLIRRRRAV